MAELPQSGSLLDRVLHSQQADTLEHFHPTEIVADLLKQLGTKEADVLRRRFGLGQQTAETLEAIGASYNVTRERVRQIQRLAVQKLKGSDETKRLLRGVDLLLQQLFEEHGGLMLEEDLLQELHQHTTEEASTKSSTIFILEEMLSEKFARVQSAGYKPYWKPSYVTVDLLEGSIAAAEQVLQGVGRPMSSADMLAGWRQTGFGQTTGKELSDEVILSYLAVANTIERNPFNEYGLRGWGSIVPKRMNDKILMVMRKHGKPMHFQDITQRINEIGFDKRQAYPPTVHNELILNKEYVLVGRGVYALREWGYKPGVVADVIADILRQRGPLVREEIVDAVLKQRMVKKNTVLLALTDKQRFQKQSDGRYMLSDTNTNTNNGQHNE